MNKNSKVPHISIKESSEPSMKFPVYNKKSTEFFQILLTLALLIFVFLSSAFIAYNKNQIGKVVKDAQPETENQIYNNTSDWETYINNRQNYQIKYPSDWFLTENTSPAPYINTNPDFIQDVVTIDCGGETPRIEIDANNQLELTQKDVESNKKSTLSIDNLPTYYKETEDVDGGTFSNYYFSKGDKIFSITTTLYPKDLEENSAAQIEKILSTFQFLPDTSDWKTYRSEGLGFEIKCPSEWRLKEVFDDFTAPTIIIYPLDTTACPLINIEVGNVEAYEISEASRKESSHYINPGYITVGSTTAFKTESLSEKRKYGSPTGEYSGRGIHLLLKNKNTYYIDYFENYCDVPSKNPPQWRHKEIFDQILSTFKFLNNNQNGPVNTDTQCLESGGVWLADYNECENIDEKVCLKLGGIYNACTSACRHNPEVELCIEVCVPVCKFLDN